MSEDLSFYLTGFKFKIVGASVDCQGKGENVIWKFKKLRCNILMIVEDMGWYTKFVSELWGDELEILQHYLWKSANFVFGLPYVCWEQQNCHKLMGILITILLGLYSSLWLVEPL